MRGSEWIKGIPNSGRAREDAVINAVKVGLCLPVEWVEVPVNALIKDGENERLVRATVFVSRDVLSVGEPDDYIRVNGSAETAQRIADICGTVLPTSKICDLIYTLAKTRRQAIEPCIQPSVPSDRTKKGFSPLMNDTAAMVQHSRAVDERLKKLGVQPIVVSNAGKDWILSNKLTGNLAANYGWFSPSAPYRKGLGHRLWQPAATAHDLHHTDYSQTIRLVKATMIVDGAERNVLDIASDPVLWQLVSDEGPLRVKRVPGVKMTDSRDEKTIPGIVIGGGEAPLYGYDVSHHQNPATVNWSEMGRIADFVIVRATYGTMKDRQTAEHVKRARDAGLSVGLYHFFRPSQDWIEQLKIFSEVSDAAGIGPGDIVPALDIERDPKPTPQDPNSSWSGICEALAGSMARHWGDALVYITKRDWGLLGSPKWVCRYRLWVPHWRRPGEQIWPPLEPAVPEGAKWAIHQYGVSKGVGRAGVQFDGAGALDRNRAREIPRIPSVDVKPSPTFDLETTVKASLAQIEVDWDEYRASRAKIVESDDE
jgi:GH25 family lysozyme M1 (1,4-beta-N-acetylmuramidase)